MTSAGVIFHISLVWYCARRDAHRIIIKFSIVGCSINMMDMTFKLIKLAQIESITFFWSRGAGIMNQHLDSELQVIDDSLLQ